MFGGTPIKGDQEEEDENQAENEGRGERVVNDTESVVRAATALHKAVLWQNREGNKPQAAALGEPMSPPQQPMTEVTRTHQGESSSSDDDVEDYDDAMHSDLKPGHSLSAEHPFRRLSPKRTTAQYRAERNAREKERSLRISRQIDELRRLLHHGGIVVPKGTKSAILSASAKYIRSLQTQQQEAKSTTGTASSSDVSAPSPATSTLQGRGSLGPMNNPSVQDTALLSRQPPASPLSGVNPFGAAGMAVPTTPLSSPAAVAHPVPQLPVGPPPVLLPTLPNVSAQEIDYQALFESCQLGMAVASLGGAIQNCNHVFCHLSGLTKEKVCSMTVFALVNPPELQSAFESISRLISPDNLIQAALGQAVPTTCSFQSCLGNPKLGLSFNIIRCRYTGAAKCIEVTLVQDSTETIRPATAADVAGPKTR